MLSAKPWKPEAIARLLLSGIVCIFLASMVVIAAHYAAAVRPVRPVFVLAAFGALGCWGVALWQAQRERTLASIKRIRAGVPSPRLVLHDPRALRALVVVMMSFGQSRSSEAWRRMPRGPVSSHSARRRCCARRRSRRAFRAGGEGAVKDG